MQELSENAVSALLFVLERTKMFKNEHRGKYLLFLAHINCKKWLRLVCLQAYHQSNE